MPADLIAEQDEMKAHMHEIVLWKRKWEEFGDSTAYEWETYLFDEAQRRNIPESAGIYTLLVKPRIAGHPNCSYLMYVGKTNSLRRRFGDYLSERRRETGRPKIYRFLNMYPEHVYFCFTLVDESDLQLIEDALQVAWMPPLNDQLPATIRRVAGAF